ncbi:MAG TPA: MFS transporter, partial [Vicinamibacteria bacterium]|nr:MFS transporter [Vicinamibacteria bacterium]
MTDSTLAVRLPPSGPDADAPEERARFAPGRVRAVTFALVLVTALSSFESTIVSTAMPTIIGELHGLSVYSWVFSAYLLAATVTMPVYGRLADVYGRRRILLIAISLFLVGAGACAAAHTMTQLILARVLQGLGAGGLMPVALTVSGDLFSVRERAKIQGVFSGVWGVASLAGPMMGAALTVTFGWRSIFSINLPLGG